MKKTIFTLVMILAATLSASAMNYEQARNEALFLTDKMAYELNLTDAQYEAAYEINLDYLMGVTGVDDVYGMYWERRNLDLSYILYSWQWEAFRAATYFFRPLYWDAGHWHFGIYMRYPRRDYFYFGRPHFYATYRGGHAWHRNGGNSFYHGRDSHFRPTLPQNRTHFGMRNSLDRGDYRGSRNGSSTRVTSGNFNRSNNGNVNRNNNDNSNRNSNFNRNSNGNANRNGSFNSNSNSNRNSNGNFTRSSKSSGSSAGHSKSAGRSSSGAGRNNSSANHSSSRGHFNTGRR